MAEQPLISVIVPVYRVEKYLEKCVTSIVTQTYKNLEIILVDDGSDDNCPTICDEWAKQDNRITVIHKKNGGLSDARNAGLESANGEYIGFVDSDDYIDCMFYEKLYSALESCEAELAICNYKMVNQDGNDKAFNNNNPPIHDEILLGKEIFEEKMLQEQYGYWVVAWNKLYKRDLIGKNRFLVGKYHEDEYFFNQIMPKCKKIACVEQAMYYYVQRSGSIMESGGHVLDKIGALSERVLLYIDNAMPASVIYNTIYTEIQLMMLEPNANLKSTSKRADGYDNIELFCKASQRLRNESLGAFRKGKCLYWATSPRMAQKQFRIIKKCKSVVFVAKRIFSYYLAQRECDAILIDTPTHKNLGDHAIVLAEQQVLKRYGIRFYELTATQINGREEKYAAVTSLSQYILVQGGGFLGSLWPNEEERFRRIVQAFNRQKIMVFPQTVTFDTTTPEGRKYLEESQKIYSSHPDLTIFAREKRSYAFIRQYFPTVKCLLVPDIVTLLNTPDTEQPRKNILFCMRRDLEKALDDSAQQEILAAVQTQYPDETIEFTDTVIDYDIRPEKRREEVAKKLSQFSTAKLIVTDRLHGMLFAALTNTPCITMSNSNGKVKAVYEWIKDIDYIRFANSVEEFKQLIQALDVNRQYKYECELVEQKFEPLLEEIRKLQKRNEK